MPRILIVEDELPMRTALIDLFAGQGYRVVAAADGVHGLERALDDPPDLLLLDVMMPKLDGYAVCREVRGRLPALPILLLTAKGLIDDRVTGLDAGADDYLVKPFSSRELLARVRALLRRVEGRSTVAEQIVFGEVAVDFVRHVCTRAGQRITLTAKEFGILKLLAEYMGHPITLGANVTVGHHAILHGCSIGDGSLVGMGAVVLNGARIGKGCLIGAGALVTEGKEFSPARPVRTLDGVALEGLRNSALGYVRNWKRFRAGLKRIG